MKTTSIKFGLMSTFILHVIQYMYSYVLSIEVDLLTFTGIGDLGCVLRVLHDAGLAGKWQALGQTLTVSDDSLDGFSTRFRGDSNLCLLHTMAAWLNGRKRLRDPPSWWRVIWAIADPMGGDKPRVARNIAGKFRG